MYVYVDTLFLLNFGMNTLVFILTAQAAGYSWRWRRLLPTAAAGSLYAVGAMIPDFYIMYSFPAKICVSGALVFLAFGRQNLRGFILILSIFYVVSFILGGAIVGWLFFIESEKWLTPGAMWSVSWTHVMGGTLIASVLIALVARSVLSKINRRGLLYQVTVYYRNRQVQITALLDSGNRLLSPLSKRPVLLVEKESILPVMGDEVCRFLRSMPMREWLSELECCRDRAWIERVEPVPYQSVGSRSMLLGFRPDRIIVDTETGKIEAGIAIISIYEGTLSTDGAYAALLHPLLMEGREITRRRERADQVANY